ncbi:unnamed protein product [Linum perenne]
MNIIGGVHLRWLSVLFPILMSAMLSHCNAADNRKIHVVYMGDLPRNGVTSAHHISLLETVLGSASLAKDSLVYSYGRSFNGFAAKLSPQEVEMFSKMESVISVIPNRKLHLHTTRSWEFVNFSPSKISEVDEGDVIIGMLDTGIWPESESFNDEGMAPPPSNWKGECHNITCNNKIIGARYYNNGGSPRDALGHGTHTSSIAAGRPVSGANFLGLAKGTAIGGVPNARIAVYKVCWVNQDCNSVDVLAGFDDAIADGVDILSMSLGSLYPLQFFDDDLAIASFHAMKRGVLTSASAGNEGPSPVTATNIAPWMLTVAASTIDRKFVSQVILGNGQAFPKLNGTSFPLVWAGDVVNYFSNSSIYDAKNCDPGSLNSFEAAGKIILCNGENPDYVGVMMANGSAAILAPPANYSTEAPSYGFPAAQLTSTDAKAILDYIRTTENPIATILATETWKDVMSPYVIPFSSRGPNRFSPEIIKPDITAPGVDILAAWPPATWPSDMRKVNFNVISGTSMSCPHVTAVAAYVKAIHLDWSPAMIKSAIMTTGPSVMDPRKNDDREFAYGAGHINPLAAAKPGLVYDATEDDYIHYLCKQGYSTKHLKLVTGQSNVSCDGVVPGRAWDLNYPTFGVVLEDEQPIRVTFTRTVTNVGLPNSTYRVSVQVPPYVIVEVSPEVLYFSTVGEKKMFKVKVFGEKMVRKPIRSGAIVWEDGVHVVRSPLVVYSNTLDSSPFKSTHKIKVWDRLKINVDGAVRAGVGGGTGWVLRDSSGSILNAIGTPYPGISDPQVLELLALRDACLWCLRFNVLQVDIEGDAETAFSLLSSSRVWATSGGAIVDEILLLQRQVPSFRFCLVRRSGNRAAHSVARLALDFLPGNLSVVLSPWVEP